MDEGSSPARRCEDMRLCCAHLLYGKGVEMGEKEAFKWLWKAAHLGEHMAQRLLGDFLNARGVERDDKEGVNKNQTQTFVFFIFFIIYTLKKNISFFCFEGNKQFGR